MASVLKTNPVLAVQSNQEVASLLEVTHPKIRLDKMALDQKIRERLERVLLEQRERAKLLAHGLLPIRKLLLIGPPGTGKTMTAAALAGELNLPLFTIKLDGLISSYLGSTAGNLRKIFGFIKQTRGIYFCDEFDAIGSERETKNEVGEMRRVLNSLLQFLEQDDLDSIVIGATNHPQILDRALFRRFDSVIEYSLPATALSEQILRERLAALDTSRVNWAVAINAATGLCHSDLTRACAQVAKNAILDGHRYVDTQQLVVAIKDRQISQTCSRGV